MWAREQSESGWRLWIADVVLWGFGRGRARLNPSPAGWHRGEEEVTAPQPIKQRVVRVRRERKPGPSARKPGLQARGGERVRLWLHTRPNILEVLRQATRKSHGLIHNRKHPGPDELLSGMNSSKGGISMSERINSVDVLILIKDACAPR